VARQRPARLSGHAAPPPRRAAPARYPEDWRAPGQPGGRDYHTRTRQGLPGAALPSAPAAGPPPLTHPAQPPHTARTAPSHAVRPLCGAVSVPCAVCLQERCPRALPPCSRPHPPNYRGRGREHSSSKDSKQADGTLHSNSKIKIKTQRPPGTTSHQAGEEASPARRHSQPPGGRGTTHMTATGTTSHHADEEPARRKVKVKPVGWRLRRRSAPGHASARHEPGRRGKPVQHALPKVARPAWNIATGTGGILAGTHARWGWPGRGRQP